MSLVRNLRNARERLCVAQVRCEQEHPRPRAAREMIQQAIDRIDGVGVYLDGWSRYDAPTTELDR